jgi:hypothetical protein
VRAVRCRDGCEPARASWRSRPGLGPLPLVCTEGPRGSARPCPQPPELGLAGCGPGRQRPARAPAPAPSRRQAPAGADRVALLHRPVRRQPPARATLPADQPGSADQPRDQGCHLLFDTAGSPRTKCAGRIRPRWLTTEAPIRVGRDGISDSWQERDSRRIPWSLELAIGSSHTLHMRFDFTRIGVFHERRTKLGRFVDVE